MMFKQWVYALKVCYKYKVIPFPFRFGNHASHITIDFEKFKCRAVWMSPLNSNFLSVFMHEIGHDVYLKKGYKSKKIFESYRFSLKKDGRPLFNVLHEESFATRFSRKALKARFEHDIMMKYFHSYTGLCFSFIPKFKLYHEQESLIRFVRKMEKRITQ